MLPATLHCSSFPRQPWLLLLLAISTENGRETATHTITDRALVPLERFVALRVLLVKERGAARPPLTSVSSGPVAFCPVAGSVRNGLFCQSECQSS